VLSQGASSSIIDETGNPKEWPPNRFTSIEHEAGQVTLTWQGSTGLYQLSNMYQIQRCENLNDEWQNVGEPTLGQSFVAPQKTPSGFYRIIILR